MHFSSAASKAGLLTVTVALSACSALQEDKIDYRSASKGTSLEVPPDLTQLPQESRYNVPGGAVSANAMLASQIQRGQGEGVARDQLADVQLLRDGSLRWLSVPRSADVLWDPVRQFWMDNGFALAMDQPNLGIMETDWAENRAKLPQDFIRNTLGRLLDSLYSTGERDKFRTRLERRADGGTDIYITHRGMIEEFSNQAKDTTTWVPRPADPELETEFLRRLLVQLGTSEEQSRAIVASGAESAQGGAPFVGATRVQVQGAPALELQDGFDRAWRRVGTALDRTGFTVEDRDRSQGIYFVRYVPQSDREQPGFFGRVLGRGAAVPAPVKYRVVVRSEGALSHVTVLSETGQPVSAEQADSIIGLLHEDLR
ncbi:outer membrane protein assembly factor BamC [Corticibacter populi]|uniref:Outer membrane protein assembly factor BamC n=1 Tax=Corticibacter populi TaxID=1550736 RepID=A0A3M6QHX6_9BURK|nr:outer membrane protein assembly factor BamC [Corticibacter populi]RMX02658.1 outer membrane protein assembly factor BamC [Corticibacter populi]